MSKSFMERLRDAANNTGDYEDYPEYSELGERLIAIDDILKTTGKYSLPNHAVIEIRKILEGESK